MDIVCRLFQTLCYFSIRLCLMSRNMSDMFLHMTEQPRVYVEELAFSNLKNDSLVMGID